MSATAYVTEIDVLFLIVKFLYFAFDMVSFCSSLCVFAES